MSPTLCVIGPYRFFFFANEGREPAHVHVERDDGLAKFWLKPVAVASSRRLASHELRAIQTIVETNAARFLEAWHEFHPD